MRKNDHDDVINTKELRKSLREVVEGVRAGRRYTVLYRSRPAFRIVPVEGLVAHDNRGADPLLDAGPLGGSGSGDVAIRHDEELYGS